VPDRAQYHKVWIHKEDMSSHQARSEKPVNVSRLQSEEKQICLKARFY
jgi:hypothetical protein